MAEEENLQEGIKVEGDYNAKQIQHLKGLEAVRMRPAMYIGDTFEKGYHHCVYEVVDNCIDEFMAGYGKNIDVTLNADGSCTVADEARGIPVDMHPTEHRPAIEVVLTELHAGGKFGTGGYQVSGGLHGVGVKCVNALSEWMEVEVRRDGKRHRIRFSRGKITEPLHVVGPAEGTGTTITFYLDNTIFKEPDGSSCSFKWDILAKRFNELAFLNPGVNIRFTEEATGRRQEFCHADGITGYVKALNLGAELTTPSVIEIGGSEKIGHNDATGRDLIVQVRISMVYAKTKWDETILTYANGINTHEGGTHLEGFKTALTSIVNAFAKDKKLLKENDSTPTGEDIRQGLTCIILVLHPAPQFEGQTKTKLGNGEVKGIVQKLVFKKLKDYFEENPQVGTEIVNKVLQSMRAREAAQKVKDKMLKSGGPELGGLLGKLADCQSNDPAECELFLVEGDSAGGSAVSGRDNRTQAILPLRGKVLNVEKANLERQLENAEIRTMITAINGGYDHDEEVMEADDYGVKHKVTRHVPFDVSKIRYNKVIIMTDADVDGAHIRTLLLTFFYRKMRALIEHGHVYMAQPPLYGIKRKGKIEYIASDAVLTNKLLKLGCGDFRFEFADGERTLESDRLSSLLDILSTAKSQCTVLEKQKIDINEFFSLRNPETGEFPRYRVASDTDGNQVFRFVFRKEEADAIKAEVQTALQCPMEELDEPENPNYTCTEIKQAATLRREMDNLVQVYGFARGDFLGGGDDAAPIGKLVDTKGVETPVRSLLELLAEIRERGGRGLTIQRYKGLGEMDYDQLFDTTMDPRNRRLRRAELVDAVEANKIFEKLMGDQVEPRRRFIEENALSADIDA
ncbi:MAG: DNA gyrase subunit B [Kiritimatiellae bacterium]|nr:DNA gyrase subunit B [Kiritimatiellia bacterium]